MEKTGIEETKELIDLVFDLVEMSKINIANGIIPSCVFQLMIEYITKDQFSNKMIKAIEGISNVPKEMVDLDSKEMTALAFHAAKRLKDLVTK